MASAKGGAPKAAKNGHSSHVPGQFLGFSLQITRCVAHLLRAHEGQSVSVEHLDDVATSGPEGVVAEQDKSGLAHNPVADRSIDLWKTLHNWVRAIRDGALKSETKFVLYVAQNHHGGVIDRIHKVATRADADALVQALRLEFWGEAPNYAARGKLPAGLAEHVNGVLHTKDDVLAHLFVQLSLENGSGSPADDLMRAGPLSAISEDKREQVLTHLLGWAKKAIDKLIEKKQPAILSWSEFQKQLIAAAKKFDRSDTVLAATPTEVTQAAIEKELRERTYVRQLKAVKLAEADLVRSVSDYLRSGTARTEWAERGDVLEGSFGEFEDGLERAWQSQKTRVDIEQKTATEEDRGRLLYANCSGLQLRLQGMDVPAYFVPGSFHWLADSLRVGWHPRFEEVLGTGGADGSVARARASALETDGPREPGDPVGVAESKKEGT